MLCNSSLANYINSLESQKARKPLQLRALMLELLTGIEPVNFLITKRKRILQQTSKNPPIPVTFSLNANTV